MNSASPRPVVALTVAISTLDRPDALARCLSSLAYGYMLPAEVVVVDQAADRRAEGVLSEFAEALRIRYVRDSRRGLGRSQNLAVAHAEHDRIAVLDDDCVPHADWLPTIARTLEEADVVTGRVLPLGPEVPGLFPVASRASTERRTFGRTALPWDVGSGNNFAFARAWYDLVGGCDERLGPGSNGRGAVDIDLFYRFVRAGARVRYEPDAVVYHERKPRAERLERRVPYGYGIGACCTLWVREGDRRGMNVLGRWVLSRGGRLARAAVRRRWLTAYEEVLVLAGTVRGVGYGLRVGSPAPRTAADSPT